MTEQQTVKIAYTVKEASSLLSISPWTLRLLIRQGKLRASNIGTGERIAYRILHDDLIDFLRTSRAR